MALERHGVHTLIGIAWALVVWLLNPSYLWWLAPVVGALVLSIPLSVITSRVGLGRKLRRRRYFLIPEEASPPPLIRATRRYWHHAAAPADLTTAVVDPIVNALVCAQAVMRPVYGWPREALSDALVSRALRNGLAALSPQDRSALLADAAALSALHVAVWTTRDAHPSWRAAIEQRPSRMRALQDAAERAAPLAEPAIAASNAVHG
jgi:membrane glycosyltransferase